MVEPNWLCVGDLKVAAMTYHLMVDQMIWLACWLACCAPWREFIRF